MKNIFFILFAFTIVSVESFGLGPCKPIPNTYGEMTIYYNGNGEALSDPENEIYEYFKTAEVNSGISEVNKSYSCGFLYRYTCHSMKGVITKLSEESREFQIVIESQPHESALSIQYVEKGGRACL